jgi:hypothetical protein
LEYDGEHLSGYQPFRMSRWIFAEQRLVSRRYVVLFAVGQLCAFVTLWGMRAGIVIEREVWWKRYPLALAAVIGICGILLTCIGMWWFWARYDDSGKWAKRIWFAVLLVGFWGGTVLYYFCVYAPQVLSGRARRELAARDESALAADRNAALKPLRIFLAWWAFTMILWLVTTLWPRGPAWVPYLKWLRVVVPLALVVAVVYSIWSLYSWGVRNARSK